VTGRRRASVLRAVVNTFLLGGKVDVAIGYTVQPVQACWLVGHGTACSRSINMAKQPASEYERRASDYVAQDLAAARQEYRFEPPAFMMGMASKLLRDPRDVPVLKTLINQLLLVIPSVLFLYSSPYSHLLGPLYFAANNILFLQRFILTLHVSEHKHIFKPRAFWPSWHAHWKLC
jgi:hypothetical protein